MDKQISQSAWVESFKPGTHIDFSGTKRTFSAEDISTIAAGVKKQVAAGYEPPLVKGHPQTDSPRKASVIDAKVGDKNVLMLQVDKIEPKFSEEVKNGEYPYVSVALYGDYSKGIRHLGALGGVAPAVKGLKQMEFSESEGEIICFAAPFGCGAQYAIRTIGRLFRKMREQLIEAKSIEEADNVYSEWDIKMLEDFESPTEQSDLGESNFAEGSLEEQGKQKSETSESDETKKENEALKAEVEALKAEKGKAEAEKAKAEAEAKKNAFAEKCNALVQAGKLKDSQKSDLIKTFELIGGGSLSFAEGESPEAMLLKPFESAEPFVKPGEYNFSEKGNEPGTAAEAAAQISEIAEKEKISHREALDRLTQRRN
jgi:hypothetical protein